MEKKMKQLPTGVVSFAEIVREKYLYADKTRHLYRLLKVRKPYFLSRPRRFGKTLLVSTLKDILEGHRQLFEGMWIENSDYNWVKNPVIHLNLNGLEDGSISGLKNDLIQIVRDVAEKEELILDGKSPPTVFRSLFQRLFKKYGRKVAVLIDEYDAPILSNIDNPKFANKIRRALKDFYGVLKAKPDERGFTFITGITKFTQTSIFSDLNDLSDITLHEDYADICGFTLEEFDALFPDYMEELLKSIKSRGILKEINNTSKLKELILEWYDGYSWDGQTRVLNPWSILNLFELKFFDDYWNQTAGLPDFINFLIKDGKIPVASISKTNSITKSVNVVKLGSDIEPIPILFQTGYLTVDHVEAPDGKPKYFLDLPNLEVRAGIMPLLLSVPPSQDTFDEYKQCKNLVKAINSQDKEGFQNSFGSYLSHYPYSVHISKEAYYHSQFLAALLIAGTRAQCETPVGDGRFDALYKSPDGTVYVFELKYCDMKSPIGDEITADELIEMEKLAEIAMKQIDVKRYTKPYRYPGAKIYIVALVIGKRTEVCVSFKKEEGMTKD
jgi:hypothetical protein